MNFKSPPELSKYEKETIIRFDNEQVSKHQQVEVYTTSVPIMRYLYNLSELDDAELEHVSTDVIDGEKYTTSIIAKIDSGLLMLKGKPRTSKSISSMVSDPQTSRNMSSVFSQ